MRCTGASLRMKSSLTMTSFKSALGRSERVVGWKLVSCRTYFNSWFVRISQDIKENLPVSRLYHSNNINLKIHADNDVTTHVKHLSTQHWWKLSSPCLVIGQLVSHRMNMKMAATHNFKTHIKKQTLNRTQTRLRSCKLQSNSKVFH